MEVNKELTLVGIWASPYAQRTWIALKEKQSKFHLKEISPEDLFGKAEWLMDLNPAGLVPVLAYKEGDVRRTVTESLICDEFIDEYCPGASLMPERAFDRARARTIMARFSSKFEIAFWRLLVEQDENRHKQARAQIDGELQYLSSILDSTGGPYILGNNFSLVDCAIAPFITRIFLLEFYRGYQMPADYLNIVDYIENVTKRPSVAATMETPAGKDFKQYLIEIMAGLADGTSPSRFVAVARA